MYGNQYGAVPYSGSAERGSISISKSLKYVIKTTPSAITKSLKYTLRRVPSAITKTLVYNIAPAPPAPANAVLKAALPRYDASTDTNLDHFSVYNQTADPTENVLIKEKSRGSLTVSAGTTGTVNHNLGYIPLVFVYGQVSGDTWGYVMGDSDDSDFWIDVTTTQLRIRNNALVSRQFKYYIFYDLVI